MTVIEQPFVCIFAAFSVSVGFFHDFRYHSKRNLGFGLQNYPNFIQGVIIILLIRFFVQVIRNFNLEIPLFIFVVKRLFHSNQVEQITAVTFEKSLFFKSLGLIMI